MTAKERVRLAMEGGNPDPPPVSLYITWPEYGWRLTGRPVWEVILGQLDGLDVMDAVLSRHPQDFAGGPLGIMGSGWLDDKVLEGEDGQHARFRCKDTGRRWRFDLRSHVLVEIDESDRLIERPGHPGDARMGLEPPATIAEAEAWFRERHKGASSAPAGPPESDGAMARWGGDHLMVTGTLAPFVAVAYAFGFEPSLILLAEKPQVFARLAERYLEHFEAHFEWAARAGYDGGHMVDSWASADIISPATYRDWVAPIYRQSAQMIRSKGLKADLYSPGDVMPLLEHMRGQGWDAIRIDDQCRGKELDIAEARRILGPDQCLFGNMSAYALLRGDWEDIAARARRQHEAAGQDGAFIISNGSGICDQTRPGIVDQWLEYAGGLGGSPRQPA